ncbi:matrixin family metalloprotease [uncultured Shewanella sp.]|uniref:matrixin family metalloprotease n=1 Tax=uncultured Shewanella sp. TaxID=173975 RepID=UPI00260B3F50|nr:matrixin family metalloprotease [uncultured Shewanella sp.]
MKHYHFLKVSYILALSFLATVPAEAKQQRIQQIRYSVENINDIAKLPEQRLPMEALSKALFYWQQVNPGLTFIESNNPSIEIKWQKYASSTHLGLATCLSTGKEQPKHCVLAISLGARNCQGQFVQSDENMVTNIIMHEIGHALGLGHHTDPNHLMYSPQPDSQVDANYNRKGYTLPTQLNALYLGQDDLISQEKTLKAHIESLDLDIEQEKIHYDDYYQQYQNYNNKTLSESQYRQATKITEEVNKQAIYINELVKKRNALTHEINQTINALGCYPNFNVRRSPSN